MSATNANDLTASHEKQAQAPQAEKFQAVVGHAKEYGFVFQSSEIYDGLAAVYDYGQNGVELKRNIREAWWKAMTHYQENVLGLDTAIFMHPTVWKASGHVDSFNDPMVDNKDSKKRYRIDHLVEDKVDSYRAAGETDKADILEADMERLLEAEEYDALHALLTMHDVRCPISNTANWTDVRRFNLMFSTQMGAVAEESNEVYLRPETAQGIFVNFSNVQKSGRAKVPFGIAQVGKAFRNEVIARQFIMRMREFEQMEMQYFVRPGTEMEAYETWRARRMEWHKSLGINPERLRYHDHIKLAHYANAAVDIEYQFPFGFKELEGIHSRTDFDLKAHQEHSGKKLQYFDPEVNQNYVPYVVETSVGLDRSVLMHLCEAYTEEEVPGQAKEDGSMGESRTRTVLKLHPLLAPYKAAILPIIKKQGLPEKARPLYEDLRHDFKVHYDEKDTIGKRYARHDALGTPFCIAIDHQTLEDDTVTARHRDSLLQDRIPMTAVRAMLEQALSTRNMGW